MSLKIMVRGIGGDGASGDSLSPGSVPFVPKRRFRRLAEGQLGTVFGKAWRQSSQTETDIALPALDMVQGGISSFGEGGFG